jgi:hypothetical protein
MSLFVTPKASQLDAPPSAASTTSPRVVVTLLLLIILLLRAAAVDRAVRCLLQLH